MKPNELQNSLLVVVRNATRLLEDAHLLFEMDRFPTAFSLCVLAREEFAKALLLHLAAEQSLPWTEAFQRALRNHYCKQLLSVVMEYLNRYDFPETAEELLKLRKAKDLPRHVIDVLHIIVHEHILGNSRQDWLDDDATIDPQAKTIVRGYLDRKKQKGLYVGIGENGVVISDPESISAADVLAEIKKTETVAGVFSKSDGRLQLSADTELPPIAALAKALAGLMTIEEFNAAWWS